MNFRITILLVYRYIKPVYAVKKAVTIVRIYIILYCLIISSVGIKIFISKPSIVINISVTIIIVSWNAVLYFDNLEVTKLNPLLEIIKRNPVTNKSLNIIIPTIQKSIISITAKEINEEITNILSASGSRNFPSGVT